MKKLLTSTLFVLMLFITNCGGQMQLPQDSPGYAAPLDISASQVFSLSMIGQTWTFQNAYGDNTFIQIQAAQFCEFGVCDGRSVTWYFSKNSPRPYWAPGVAGAELYFTLHNEPDGSWVCIGFKWFDGAVQRSAAVSMLPGWSGKPYIIIPASSASPAVNTAYLAQWNFGYSDSPVTAPDGSWISTWTTYAFTEQTSTPFTGTVNALISKQCEGGHSGQCDGVLELWHFCPGVGLCAIEPITAFDANGNVVRLDPNLTVMRIP